ncbi:conjugal transfer protein TraG N-terminal domain-containing protein [Piscirickettsia litoralis]|uniref:TraG N-terminal Proteobacteria domain-containing protein n=1 Tax=Piscirickettsia litoralis TaxID=1891921 RepID=A0ABX3A1M4_9GAMM|nr:conjugal transfer protein TraG N-terminal domain-containing protein [Piscirickettsia litoralis]ODN41350.1 hypothetical protein BGC07_16395 [Piscirickettsia litoralis]
MAIEFTVYSIGNVNFLAEVMGAVKMLTGNGEFKKIMMIGFLLSALFTGIQAIANGGKFDFPQLVLGWVLYSCAFWPTATVHIESTYNGAARSVDNMPVGIAAPASIISSIGYKITELFETAYSRPTSITQNTFAAPLSILVDVRRMMTSPQIIMAMNTAISSKGGSDIERSWKNYISECTLNKVDLGQDTLQHMYSETALQAAHYDSYNLGTRLYLDPNGKPQDVTCEQAYKMLTSGNASITRLMNDTNVKGALASVVHDPNAFNTLDEALNTMTSGAQSAQQFMLDSFIDLMWGPAAIKRYQDFQGFNQAEMLHQSLMQRDTQWAAQSNLFVSAMQPLMTFFEGLSYAITPFVAFMLVFGMAGLQFAKRYVQTLIWIQLWMPIMSIINLFLVMVSSGEMSSIPVLTSMSGLSSMDSILSHWISVGGLLISATPAISLSLVYGGSVAATNLSGKISAGDTINEKIMTPDLMQPQAANIPDVAYHQNRYSGPSLSGAPTASLDMSKSFGESVSRAQTQSAQATESFGQQLSRGFQSAYQHNNASAFSERVGKTISGSHSHSAGVANSITDSVMKQFSINKSHRNEVAGAVALDLSGSAGANLFKAIGAKASIHGSGSKSSTDTANQMAQFVNAKGKDLGFSQKDSAELLQNIAHGTVQDKSDSFSKSMGSSEAKSLQRSAQKVNSKTDALSRAKTQQSQYGSSFKVDLDQAAGWVQSQGKQYELGESYRALVGSGDVQEDDKRNAMATFAPYYTSQSQLQNMAEMRAMSYSPKGREALQNILFGGSKSLEVDTSKPQQELKGIKPSKDLSEAENIKGNVEDNLNKPINGDAVKEQYGKWESGVENSWKSQRAEAAKERLKENAPQLLRKSYETPSLASRLLSSDDKTRAGHNSIANKHNAERDALFAGFHGNKQAFDKLMTDAQSPEKRTAMMEQIKNDDQAFTEKYGVIGSIGKGVENAGRTIAGAALSGYDYAEKFITGHHSDLGKATQGMSWQEKGAFLTAAATTVNKAGGEAVQQFWSQNEGEYKGTIAQMAQNEYGLTKDQSTIFAENYSSNPNQANINTAMNNMKKDYDNKDFLPNNTAESLKKVISDSSKMGDQAGAWLAGVSTFNSDYNDTKEH